MKCGRDTAQGGEGAPYVRGFGSEGRTKAGVIGCCGNVMLKEALSLIYGRVLCPLGCWLRAEVLNSRTHGLRAGRVGLGLHGPWDLHESPQ